MARPNAKGTWDLDLVERVKSLQMRGGEGESGTEVEREREKGRKGERER